MKFKEFQNRIVARRFEGKNFEDMLDNVRSLDDETEILMQFNVWLHGVDRDTMLGVNTREHLPTCEWCRQGNLAMRRIFTEEAFSMTAEMWMTVLGVEP